MPPTHTRESRLHTLKLNWSETEKKMSGKFCIAVGIILAAFCFVFIVFKGDTGVYAFNTGSYGVDELTVEIENGKVEPVGKEVRDGQLIVTVRSVERGRDYITVKEPGDLSFLVMVYVHRFGIITENHFFGRCNGDYVIPVCIVIWLAVILLYLIKKYRAGLSLGLYRYENVSNLALVIFFSLLLAVQIFKHIRMDYPGLIDSIRDALNSSGSFTFVLLPVAVVVSVLVALSNINLMRKEGINFRNMLGVFLGVLLCAGSFFPEMLDWFLRYKTNINIYNELAPAVHIEKAVENIVTAVIAYTECILLGTIIESIKAARRIPAPDKDYIIILGCKIRKDGSLTNLLIGRADRAVEFAKMQKEKTGKNIVFVPSGGQGADEVMPEAQAIKNYLLSRGIDEKSILVEDRSADTDENFRYSSELIKENAGKDDIRIAFSTTNYHVFRSGLTAARQGIKAEGIGSRTKAYFWINAFMREFIATIHFQRKKHLKIAALLAVLTVLSVAVVYVSDSL